ncbi:MAG: hypothetical protein WCP53_16300, partial [Verrucomicrobiota bacterium]
VLQSIEHGNATRLGMGVHVIAEAQRVANELLRSAVNDAKRMPFGVGRFTEGADPAMLQMDDWLLARDLRINEAKRSGIVPVYASAQEAVSRIVASEDPAFTAAMGGPSPAAAAAAAEPRASALSRVADITYDPSNPLGTLQYGFKKRRIDSVVLDLAQVPGLSEELVTQNFQTWTERANSALARKAYNWVFGPRSNAAVTGEVRQRFIARLATLGVDSEVASDIWKAWKEASENSRSSSRHRTANGIYRMAAGDNPLYATVNNIPNGLMDQIAVDAVERVITTRTNKGIMDHGYAKLLRERISYSDTFRESTSFTRRTLADLGGKPSAPGVSEHPLWAPEAGAADGAESLGKHLARAYGMAAHNKFVTTTYYWFRFGLDVRFHAMNYFESQILYLGRAGLKHGEIDTGLLGQTAENINRVGSVPLNDLGFAAGRGRASYVYKTFLKEQPDALRAELRGLAAEDPELMKKALLEMGNPKTGHPDIAAMITDMGETPWPRP